MHIVLSGYYGFANVGDEAILFSIIHALKEIEPTIEISVLSNNPEQTEKAYHVHAVNRWSIKEVSQVIKHADGLISGGGSLFQDETSMKTIPYYAGIIKIAQWHQIPVFIYAQGMGPVKSKISKWIMRRTLNKVEKITVRDKDSQKLLHDIGVRKDSTIVPDPVLALYGRSFRNNWIQEQHFKKPLLTVSVRAWGDNKEYMKKLAGSLDSLVQSGYEIVFVPMHGSHDERTSLETAAFMSEESSVAPGDASIEEKISIIGESELLIGVRLHSLIFAAVQLTPFVALSYDPKIDAFASICDQPVAGHVESAAWDAESLYESIEHSLANRLEQQRVLKENVIEQHKKVLETPELAIKAFKK